MRTVSERTPNVARQRKQQQRQRRQPERQQLVMQRRSQPQTQEAPRVEGRDSTWQRVPSAPLYIQPSLFGGIASAFDLFPTLHDNPVFHLNDEQLEVIAMLQDYLALAGDRSRVTMQFRDAIRRELLRMSGERRAIGAQSVIQGSQGNNGRVSAGDETGRQASTSTSTR